MRKEAYRVLVILETDDVYENRETIRELEAVKIAAFPKESDARDFVDRVAKEYPGQCVIPATVCRASARANSTPAGVSAVSSPASPRSQSCGGASMKS